MTHEDYQLLAAFRKELRGFLAFSKSAVEDVGLAPQQYQALLAIKAREGEEPMTVTSLGAELFIRHNSAVELAARLAAAELVERAPGVGDRRVVTLRLTGRAEERLAALAAVHLRQLREQAPRLVRILDGIGGT